MNDNDLKGKIACELIIEATETKGSRALSTENNNQVEKSNELYTLLGNVNEDNIYKMLHEFRNWNRDWDTFWGSFMTKKPKSTDQFVAMLAKKYEVIPK